MGKDTKWRKPIVEVASLARSGRQLAALDAFSALTTDDDARVATAAAAGATGILAFTGRWGEAAELVERTMFRWSAADYDGVEDAIGIAFGTLVVGAEIYQGIAAVPRITAIQRQVAANPPLARAWGSLLASIEQFGLTEALPAYLIPIAFDLFPTDEALFRSDWTTLSRDQHEQMWSAAASGRRADLLIALYDAGIPVSNSTAIAYGLAAYLWEAGRWPESELVTRRARLDFDPLHIWQTLPVELAAQQYHYPLLTPLVRAEYLTLPMGER